ncbi:Ig domain-containing protein [Streptosporangium lutulentum]
MGRRHRHAVRAGDQRERAAPRTGHDLAAPAEGKAGRSYSHTFTASAFPKARFTVTGGKPPRGLKLDGESGVLSGVPLKAERVTFTVTAANGVNPAARQEVVIKISPAKGDGDDHGHGNGGHGNDNDHGHDNDHGNGHGHGNDHGHGHGNGHGDGKGSSHDR